MSNLNSNLGITEREFLTLPSKEQMCLLFKNQVDSRNEVNTKLNSIEKLIRGYNFHRKIQYVWLSTLTTFAGAIIAKYGNVIFPLVGLVII